jgi:indolepyruvate ferredoxin oxidoreductase beta subunit
MKSALARSPEFAMGLSDLPRVLKGYSDTLIRGKRAYARILDGVVRPAIAAGSEAKVAKNLRDAIGAALADDKHEKLDAVLEGRSPASEVPVLKQVSHV